MTADDGGDRSGLSTIIEAARRGGVESLNRLLKAAHVYCRLFALHQTPRKLSSRFDASDVGIVSLADVARDFRSFQGRSREFLGWLRQIVVHNTIDLQRRHARSIENETLLAPGLDRESASIDDTLLRVDQKEQVEMAMSKLTEDHRAVLRLRVWEGLKWDEIGCRLRRSPDAARQLFARALDAVRADLGDESAAASRGA